MSKNLFYIIKLVHNIFGMRIAKFRGEHGEQQKKAHRDITPQTAPAEKAQILELPLSTQSAADPGF